MKLNTFEADLPRSLARSVWIEVSTTLTASDVWANLMTESRPMEDPDVRWKQRYRNFSAAVDNLREALTIDDPNKFERQGLIKAFELAYELAWKTLQDYLRELGIQEVVGPKPVIRRAFSEGLIHDGTVWQAMHQARNESSHLYDEDHARSVEKRVREEFAPLLSELRDMFKDRYSEQ